MNLNGLEMIMPTAQDIITNTALVMKKNNISQVLVTDKNQVYQGVVHILDIIKQGISYE